VLLAATRAIAGTPIEIGHYEDYFRWRAENLRGYLSLYEKFRARADAAAQRRCGREFALCDSVQQRSILDQELLSQPTASRFDTVRSSVFQRGRLIFEKYIFSEVLALFAATDAWKLLGYDGWPGTPRGLEAYRLRPGPTGA
jgi:hypothetical protein